MSLLNEIREANKAFQAGTVKVLDPAGDPFIVVACIDARLTCLLESALGLPRGRAIVVRTAGNHISEANRDALRSIAAGAYIKGARELFIVGHTDCAMANFSAAEVAENFRKAGIARSAFGDVDLRTWFGAFADVKANVIQTIGYLRQSGLMPEGLKIHGLVLGTTTGELEVVLDGDLSQAAPSAARPELAASMLSQPAKEGATQTPPPGAAQADVLPPLPGAHKGPIVIPVAKPEGARKREVPPPTSMVEAVKILQEFLARERQDSELVRILRDIGNLLKSEKNPVRVLAMLEHAARDYEARYPRLPGALEYLKESIDQKGTSGLRFMEFLRRILQESR